MNTMYSISGGDIYKLNRSVLMPFETVMVWLWYSQTKQRIDSKVQEIRAEQQKQRAKSRRR